MFILYLVYIPYMCVYSLMNTRNGWCFFERMQKRNRAVHIAVPGW